MYFSGQGKLYIHTRDGSGNPQGGLYVGNAKPVKFSLTTDIEEHTESTSGQRLTDLRLQKAKKATFSVTFEDFVKDNLAIALYGSVDAVTGGTVTNENLVNPVVVGQLLTLSKQNVSSLVIIDSTGSPKTLPGGQYSANLKHGSLTINDRTAGGPYVDPFKASYSYGAATRIGMFTQPIPERWVRFEGVNTADGNKEVVVEFYKVSFDPAAEFDLINDAVAGLPLTGTVLLDPTKASNDIMGQFGRYIAL